MVSIVALLLSSEGLSVFQFTYDPDSPSYLTFSMHPQMLQNSHTGFFIVVSTLMMGSAWLGIVSLKNFISYWLFVIIYGLVATKALIDVNFPITLSNSEYLGHDMISFPFIYLYATIVLSTIVVSYHSTTSGFGALVKILAFAISVLIPFIGLGIASYMDLYRDVELGVSWSAFISYCGITVISRILEVKGDITLLTSGTTWSRDTGLLGHQESAISIGLISAILGMAWSIRCTMISTALDGVLSIPMSCLLMAFTRRGAIASQNIHPVVVAGSLMGFYWFIMGCHAIFIKGLGEDSIIKEELNLERSNSFVLVDHNVSIWTSESVFMPILSIALLIIPMPAIVLGFLRRKNESEELLFILAVLSGVSVLGGQINSIRCLGIAGIVFGAWRCYDISSFNQKSNRLI